MNALPQRFQLDPIFLRPRKIRDGSLRPLSPYENLLNNELLLVLNGKPVGYTLDFSVETNLGITGFEFDNSFILYNQQNRDDMNNIFQLAEDNELFFVKASNNPNWAIYFQEENANQALVLDFFLKNYRTTSKVNAYIISRLQGFNIQDIEANIFCYQNGQNIIEMRAERENNLNAIIQNGNNIINKIQNSQSFIKYLKKVKIRKVENFSIQ